MRQLITLGIGVSLWATLTGNDLCADEPKAPQPPTAASQAPKSANLVRLDKVHEIWIEKQKKWVVVDGEVCLRAGQLELFACPKGTKEHESVIALNSKAYLIHAALLAVGAKPGKPVSWDPEYAAAEGPIIDVHVLWTDKAGKRHRVKAQEWVKHVPTGKPMTHDWVFAGSSVWVDEQTGTKHYQADAGDLICLSNFSTAMLDLPIKSSGENSNLLFVANTEKIPPLGTKVRVVLVPRPPKKVQKNTPKLNNDAPPTAEEKTTKAAPQ